MLIIKKGHTFVKMYVELVIFSAHRVIMTTFCIMFPEMIFSGFRVMGRTCLILLIRKEHNSIKFVCAVIILVLCTSSNNGLQLYQVSQNGFSYEADTICDGQTDRPSHSWTDEQTDSYVSSRGGHIFQLTDCLLFFYEIIPQQWKRPLSF